MAPVLTWACVRTLKFETLAAKVEPKARGSIPTIRTLSLTKVPAAVIPRLVGQASINATRPTVKENSEIH